MSTSSGERHMYRWRNMSTDERADTLALRRRQRLPWHSPPHYVGDTNFYLLTAACYEHAAIIGHSDQRMAQFEARLLSTLGEHAQATYAWTVLPNHYHALVQTCDVRGLLKSLGQLHGRTSYDWNGEESRRGRKVWFNTAETPMKSERNFWATLLYVLHNAVRHGYVKRWQDWPFCNAGEWLEEIGHERAARLWREYPIDE